MTKLSTHHLPDLLPRLRDARVCIIGDIMLDEYLTGDADRISPEAPIPIVHVTGERNVLGGAANVARNIRMLGGRPTLISLCGTDARAGQLREELEREDIRYFLVGDKERPTTLKTRVLARNQQMLRIDREDTRPANDETQEAVLRNLKAVLTQDPNPITVLILSDYGKGMVSAGFMEKLSALLATLENPVKLLIDPKTPNFHLYASPYLLTPNQKETREGSGLPTDSVDELLCAGQRIFKERNCRHLLTTLGPQGMALFLDAQNVVHIPSAARKVFDVTGAGDTVIAVIGQCLAAGLSLLDACLIANQAAGIVVGQVGAASVTLEELDSAVQGGANLETEYWAKS